VQRERIGIHWMSDDSFRSDLVICSIELPNDEWMIIKLHQLTLSWRYDAHVFVLSPILSLAAAENHSCGEGGPSLAQFQGGSHSQAAQSFMPSGHHSSHVQNHANYGSGGHHSQNQNQSSYGDGSDLPKPSQQDTGFGNQMAGAAQNYISGKLGGGGGGMLGQAAGFLSRDADGYEGRQVSSQDEDQDGGYRRHQQAPQHHGAPHGSGSHGSYGRDHESSGESGEFPAMPDERRYGGGEHNAPHYSPPQEGGWQQGEFTQDKDRSRSSK